MSAAVSQAPPPERWSRRRRMRRLGLGLFFGSVVVNAGLGIAALLSGDFGETEGKVLTTSLCVTGGILLVLLCEPAWERSLLRFVPQIGSVAGVAGFGLLIAAIWIEPDNAGFLPRMIGTLLTVSTGAALASLLALATLPLRLRLAFRVALALIAIAVAMLLPVYWADWANDWYLRVIGVVVIALAAFTVTIPVLHRVTRSAPDGSAAPIAPTPVTHCPFCGGGLVASLGVETSCPACERRFVVATGARSSAET